MNDSMTLSEFILSHEQEGADQKNGVGVIINTICEVSKTLQYDLGMAGLIDVAGSYGGENIHGEQQQKLDVFANEKFKQALSDCSYVCGLVSEEEDQVVDFKLAKDSPYKYIVALDPVDGSSNIDVGIPVGTIFSIYRKPSVDTAALSLEEVLQPGRQQVAAGYILYGSSTILVFTTGNGVSGFTLEEVSGEYRLSHPDIRTPKQGRILSINEGNSALFPSWVREYLDHCKYIRGNQQQPYRCRYVGSLVADVHRNLLKGGLFMYPAYRGHEQGKLRLLYESNPMAFIVEQAGGAAYLGHDTVLDSVPESIHQRTPLFIGSESMIDEMLGFIQ